MGECKQFRWINRALHLQRRGESAGRHEKSSSRLIEMKTIFSDAYAIKISRELQSSAPGAQECHNVYDSRGVYGEMSEPLSINVYERNDLLRISKLIIASRCECLHVPMKGRLINRSSISVKYNSIRTVGNFNSSIKILILLRRLLRKKRKLIKAVKCNILFDRSPNRTRAQQEVARLLWTQFFNSLSWLA